MFRENNIYTVYNKEVVGNLKVNIYYTLVETIETEIECFIVTIKVAWTKSNTVIMLSGVKE